MPCSHKARYQNACGAQQADRRRRDLRETVRMLAIEDRLGQQRRDHRASREKGRSPAPQLGHLTLLLGQRLGTQLVHALFEARHRNQEWPARRTIPCQLARPRGRSPPRPIAPRRPYPRSCVSPMARSCETGSRAVGAKNV
jgi:hypothetical protein